MNQRNVFYLVLVFISSMFCADILAVTWQAHLGEVPGIMVRSYQPDWGKGEAGKAFADYNVIPRRNLFGLSQPAKPVLSKEVEPAPAPRRVASIPKPAPLPKKVTPPKYVAAPLRLRLTGTINGAASWARAILEDLQTKEELLLKIGDKVQGAELTEIKEAEVILTRQGSRISLKLGEDGQTTSASQPPPVVEPVAKVEPVRRPSPIALNVPEIVPVEEEQQDSLLEKEGLGTQIDEWNWNLDRQAVVNRLNNLGELVNQASVLPHFVNGHVQGFRVSNIAPQSLFVNLGAQDGDIIEEVNGIALSNVNQVMSLYSELQVAPELRVRIKRGNSYHFLVYDLQ